MILLSFIGIGVIPWIPVAWMPALILFLATNAAGSMGDVFIVFKLLTQQSDVFIQDLGDKFTIYGVKKEKNLLK